MAPPPASAQAGGSKQLRKLSLKACSAGFVPKSQDIEIIVKPSKKKGAHQMMEVCAEMGVKLHKFEWTREVCAEMGVKLHKVE